MTHPPLHHIWVSESPATARWLFVLHGILGSGQNFRGLVRQLIASRPRWGAVLVDLRMHGRSLDRPPPHTLRSAAEDLRELAAQLPGEPAAVLGHSFGGKVAATYASLLPEGALEHVWILDSPLGARPDGLGPGPGSETTQQVLTLLDRAPTTFASRTAFIEHVTSQGQSAAIGQWLAMNLRRTDEGFRFTLDLDAIRALLDDYYGADLWPWLESTRTPTSLVLGADSEVWSAAQRQRAEAVAQSHAHVELRVVPRARHWLHVDNPEGTRAAILEDWPVGRCGRQ